MGSEDSRDVTQVQSIGGHHPGFNNAGVLSLVITNRNNHFMPTKIDTFFPNLQAIRYNRWNIEAVEVSDLNVFPELRQLDLSDNQIKTIGRNLFSGNPSIRAIDLSRNPIKHIAHYVFDNLNNLQFLELTGTGCTSIQGNSTSMQDVRFSIFLSCPPTSTMIGDEILNGQSFLSIIENLENKIAELEDRLNHESTTMETTVTETSEASAPTETTTEEASTEETAAIADETSRAETSILSFLKRFINQKSM